MIALIVVVLLGVAAVAAPFFGDRRPWDVEETTELDRLFERKGRVLRAIKDVDHEHEAGLLSDDDWRETREEFVGEAVRLNREIAALTGLDAAAAVAETDAPAEELSEAAK